VQAFWRAAKLTVPLFLFSSHWTPRLVDEGVGGSPAQTTQHTVVLEGTYITLYMWLDTCHRLMLFLLQLWFECVRFASKMPFQLSFLSFQPSKQFRANGQNVSYIVSGKKLPGANGKVCSTKGNCCTFQLPERAKKVYLRAVNAAGRSRPTEVRIYRPKGNIKYLKPAWRGPIMLLGVFFSCSVLYRFLCM